MRLGILAIVVSMVAACGGFSGPGAGPDATGGDDAPPAEVTVAFATDSSVTDHSSSSHTIQVVLSAPASGTVTVNYHVVPGGTATSGTDFILADGGLTFPAGVTAQTITMEILKPAMDEPDVALTIAIDGPEGATLGQPSQHHVTISANMLPRINFNPASLMLSETVTNTGISVALDSMSTVPIMVDYKVVAAQTTATGGGVDYTLADGTLTISAGTLGNTIPLVVINDTLDEDDETIAIQLSNPVNAELGPTSLFTYTILDDDPPPSVAFTAATTSFPEAAGLTSVPVALSTASGKTITVPYTVTLGTASAADVAVSDGTLTFAPGVTTQSIPVMIIQDLIDEDDETFTLTLGTPANATLGTNASDLVTIVDDDAPPTMSITTASESVPESVGTVALTVALSAPSGKDITVAFTGSGTATQGADYSYAPVSQTFDFPAGTLSQTITITVVDDTLDEPNETLITTLGTPTNATLATASQTVTILDNDPTCIGPTGSPYQVCLTDMPAAPVSLTANINTNATGGSPLCLATAPMGWAPTQPDSCFIVGTTITVPLGQTIKVSGGRPLVLVASDSITIAGTLDVSSKQGGTTGPANSACGPYTVMPVGGPTGGGGGAGGSFMSQGGNGGSGNGNGSMKNAGGGSLGADQFEPTILRGGCDGQKGGAGGMNQSSGSIGHGGGVVYLLAQNTLDLSGGIIDASGSGAVGGDMLAGGSGAGSGGMIELYATTITTTAATKLFANGGGGASGADAITSGSNGADPTAAAITTSAAGGGTAPDNGGRGFAVGSAAQAGASAPNTISGGGGGGGGGFIQANQSLGVAATSAGVVD